MQLIYITIDQAVKIHAKTVEVSGGGSQGMLDKITHLFFCANKFHCFQDGNKRIAITLSAQFLLFNGYMYCVSDFMREMENISYHLAAGKIDKEFLRDLIEAVINESYDENEELKLRLLNAIQEEL